MKQPKVVLVTDWITTMGGGEKVVEQFHKLYPEAPVYTSYCTDNWRVLLDGKVVTGYLQNWPFSKLRRFLPVLRQWWFARLDLSNYDTVISITGNGEAKFIRTTENQVHICYCHTPPHFYWAQYDEYLKRPSMRPYWLARLGLRVLVKPLRKRDYKAAQQVNCFIANSTNIQKDISRFYNRDSTVIFPPINCEQFMQLSTRGEKRIQEVPHCIWWGRIVPAKRLDIAIEACNQLAIPFTIIGKGPALADLQKIAGPTITFTGYAPDKERDELIKTADLFLFPSFEDFGVAPVEALAAGVPIVAFGSGGALDYVLDGTNGVLFDTQTSESLTMAIQATNGKIFESTSDSVEKFDVSHFRSTVQSFVAQINTKRS